ncbi:CRISPR-associated protein Cas4 [Thiorhodovibrio frisius]|uniref:CRISPR-associated exonuclease Cas4 n=1 Tax=Thiorhodovibrio frisius TaxID=631362 RepID=H8Z3V7_9GAMM|nr:CRISPR-associated protein Cas4 [Thiorhodovibrio frisius]EIC21109.1 CRISPR-associated protein Cas4 [Thiorhodovibrio frisius]WPL22169.1 CRISPR-associated protein Cas4/endonuclease Cas1 fusion [Thiorhodovibrio frisius]
MTEAIPIDAAGRSSLTGLVDPIAISALQHWAYCPRQCALIHQEQSFTDNLHTARGQAVHHLVDQPGEAIKAGVKIERSLPLWSERLGLIGKADLVEIHPDGAIFPVEYKHGRKRQAHHDDIQLAAQALCLEEMFDRPVPRGAIYHATSHRRREVAIDNNLRAAVADTLTAIRTMLASNRLPPPVNDRRCRECSLSLLCQPELIGEQQRFNHALSGLFDPEFEAD